MPIQSKAVSFVCLCCGRAVEGKEFEGAKQPPPDWWCVSWPDRTGELVASWICGESCIETIMARIKEKQGGG